MHNPYILNWGLIGSVSSKEYKYIDHSFIMAKLGVHADLMKTIIASIIDGWSISN